MLIPRSNTSNTKRGSSGPAVSIGGHVGLTSRISVFFAAKGPSPRDPLGGPWGLLAFPGVLALAAVFAVPVFILVFKSLYLDAGMARLQPGITLENYIRFFGDPFYLGILWETLKLGFVVVTACIILGYPVAYFLARTEYRHRGLLIFLIVAPLFISVVVRNLGWVPLLSDSGFVNWVLIKLGVVSTPLKLINNFTGVVIGLTHSSLPFMILTLIPVIQRIDPSIEEASQNLGASPWQTFLKVVLPLSKPGLLGGYLLILTTTIAAFTTPAVLGGRRVLVMPVYIEQQFRSALQYGLGATIATVLLITGAILTLVSMRDQSKES